MRLMVKLAMVNQKNGKPVAYVSAFNVNLYKSLVYVERLNMIVLFGTIYLLNYLSINSI